MEVLSPSLRDTAVLQCPGEPVPPAWLCMSAVCATFSQCLLSSGACVAQMFIVARGLLHMAGILPGFAAGSPLTGVTVTPPVQPHPQGAQSTKPQLLLKLSLFHLVGVIRSCAWKSNQIIHFLSVLFIPLFVLFLERKLSQIAPLSFPIKAGS